MLTYAELVELERSLCDEHVLSVYLDGSAPDPAAKPFPHTSLLRQGHSAMRLLLYRAKGDKLRAIFHWPI